MTNQIEYWGAGVVHVHVAGGDVLTWDGFSITGAQYQSVWIQSLTGTVLTLNGEPFETPASPIYMPLAAGWNSIAPALMAVVLIAVVGRLVNQLFFHKV